MAFIGAGWRRALRWLCVCGCASALVCSGRRWCDRGVRRNLFEGRFWWYACLRRSLKARDELVAWRIRARLGALRRVIHASVRSGASGECRYLARAEDFMQGGGFVTVQSWTSPEEAPSCVHFASSVLMLDARAKTSLLAHCVLCSFPKRCVDGVSFSRCTVRKGSPSIGRGLCSTCLARLAQLVPAGLGRHVEPKVQGKVVCRPRRPSTCSLVCSVLTLGVVKGVVRCSHIVGRRVGMHNHCGEGSWMLIGLRFGTLRSFIVGHARRLPNSRRMMHQLICADVASRPSMAF